MLDREELFADFGVAPHYRGPNRREHAGLDTAVVVSLFKKGLVLGATSVGVERVLRGHKVLGGAILVATGLGLGIDRLMKDSRIQYQATDVEKMRAATYDPLAIRINKLAFKRKHPSLE